MIIFAIDDEPKMLRLLHRAIAEVEPSAEIMDFDDGAALLRAVGERRLRPDVVFADIELRGESGLVLAMRIKDAAPESKIIFVTGYPQYAVDAYRLHANGYILKPAEPQRIREELDALSLHRQTARGDKLVIRCFGSFDVFWREKPLSFTRTQTKELLAYLIDREGANCAAEEIASALWKNDHNLSAAKNRLRVLVNDLRTTLRGIGMEDVLVRERRHLAIRRELVDCDYYRLCAGDVAAVNEYRGAYMKQYHWAELTAERIKFLRISEQGFFKQGPV